MPTDISSSRPAAFRRGPIIKPKSCDEHDSIDLPAMVSKALIPEQPLLLLIRCRPYSIKIRLFSSSGTTSATVPKATRSRNFAMFGSGNLSPNQSLSRNTARTASIT